MKAYKIPLVKKKIADGVFSSRIFTPDMIEDEQVLNEQEINEKVILMVGGTGTGKTTLINRMINYLFGVNYTDPFRFQLIEETGRSKTKSQTTDIHKYTIQHKTLPHNISVIDTPGICSTDGKDEDMKTIEKIRQLFEKGTFEKINAICIVEKHSTSRLQEHQIYTLQTIVKIFGSDVRDIIYIMATFCDDIYDDTGTPEQPELLESFKEENIPFKEFYLFNNKRILTHPVNVNSVNIQIQNGYWETGTHSFKLFFENLEVSDAISLALTKEILHKKTLHC